MAKQATNGIRAQQKEKTRRALIDAAMNQLSAETGFSSLSLREVAREANIAPTSFYRHFRNMDELGLTLVDECGLTLRQLLRQARQRIEKGGSIIRVSIETLCNTLPVTPPSFGYYCRSAPAAQGSFAVRWSVSLNILRRNWKNIW